MPARIVFMVKTEDLALAVEIKRHPALEGKPVVVGSDSRKGQVLCLSRPVAQAGILKGMPMKKARRLLPSAVFIRHDRQACAKAFDQLVELLRDRCGRVQPVALDEAYVDVTSRVAASRSPGGFAQEVIREVREKTGLVVSVGGGPNKLIANVACHAASPGSFMVVSPRDVRGFLFPLPVRRLPGVGPRTEGALRRMGIETVGQLARVARESLVGEFGRFGYRLHQVARGIDESEVVGPEVRRSIVRSRVFEEDLEDVTVVAKALEGISSEAYNALVAGRAYFRTVGLMMRFGDDRMRCRQSTVLSPSDRLDDLQRISRDLMEEIMESPKPVRGITLALAGLSWRPPAQKTVQEFTRN